MLTFTNSYDHLTAGDQIVIVVTTTGGFTPDVVRVPAFTVETVCGPGSTEVNVPTIGESAQPANQYPDIMAVSDTSDNGVFTPTNPLCPITSYALSDDGGGIYDFVTDTTPSYVVSLKGEYLHVIDTYAEFEVAATADGGASASARGYMRVGPPEYDCRQSVIT